VTDIQPLIPRRPVPPLAVPLAGGGTWRLADQKPQHFTLIAFYRGLHCPICSRYLGDLESKLDELAKRGVGAVAISSDGKERAEEAKRKWNLAKLAVGYDLGLADARRWGLYVSAGRGKTSIGVEEPALFSEPGLFLVRPDGTLYFGAVQTMPFARPHFADILGALDFVIAKDYPARGEVASLPPDAAAVQ
jgi:peroxiredoxin